jgi:hypothetical protein
MDNGRVKTLAEMAAEAESAGGSANQWTCKRCGGRQWWVRNSYFVQNDGTRHRKRECRQCHATLYTRETAICSNTNGENENLLDEGASFCIDIDIEPDQRRGGVINRRDTSATQGRMGPYPRAAFFVALAWSWKE